MFQDFCFRLKCGFWSTTILLLRHWFMIILSLGSIVLTIVALTTLKWSTAENEIRQSCTFAVPELLSSSVLHPFLLQALCEPPVEHQFCQDHTAVVRQNNLHTFLKVFNDLQNEELDESPKSVQRILTKNLNKFDKFLDKITPPTVQDLLMTPFELVTSVSNYKRLEAVTKDRLETNLSDVGSDVLSKINWKQMLLNYSQSAIEKPLCDTSNIKKYVLFSEDLELRLNSICQENYPQAKVLVENIFNSIDWRKLYHKLQVLKTTSGSPSLTPGQLKSLEKMHDSSQRIKGLRSLLWIVYTTKFLMENLEDSGQSLINAGWTPKEIETVVADLLEIKGNQEIEDVLQFALNESDSVVEVLTPLILILVDSSSYDDSDFENCKTPSFVEVPRNLNSFLNFITDLNHLFYGQDSSFNDSTVVARLFLNMYESYIESLDQRTTNEKVAVEYVDSCYLRPLIFKSIENIFAMNVSQLLNESFEFLMEASEEDMKRIVNLIDLTRQKWLPIESYTGRNIQNMISIINSTLLYLDHTLTNFILIEAENSTIQSLIDHPILELKPTNVVDIFGKLIITELGQFLLNEEESEDPRQKCFFTDNDLTTKLKCSLLYGIPSTLSSPLFNHLSKTDSILERPSIFIILRKAIESFKLVSRLTQEDQVPLAEVDDFLEYWSQEANWEELESSISNFESKWRYLFLDELIPKWNLSKVVVKVTEFLSHLDIYLDNLLLFIKTESQTILNSIDEIAHLNDSWSIGLQKMYRRTIINGDKLLNRRTICGELEANKSFPLIDSTVDEISKLCGIDLGDLYDSLEKFSEDIDIELKLVKVSRELDTKVLFHMMKEVKLKWTKFLLELKSFQTSFQQLQFFYNSDWLQDMKNVEEEEDTGNDSISSIRLNLVLNLINIFNQKENYRLYTKFYPGVLQKLNIFELFIGAATDQLNNSPSEIFILKELILKYIPLAMKDVVIFVSTSPKMFHSVYPLLMENASLCSMDMIIIGENIKKVQEYFCSLPLRSVPYHLDKLLLGAKFKKNFIEKSDEVTLELLENVFGCFEFVMHFDTNATFDASLWNKIFDTVLNVTVDDVYENGAMIWSEKISSLVDASQSGQPKSEKLREILQSINGNLRLLRLSLKIIAGGDVWNAVKESYEDKPMIAKFFDLLEKTPEMLMEIFQLYSSNPDLLYEFIHTTSWNGFCLNVMSYPEHHQLSENLNILMTFLCEEASRELLLQQLNPKSLPSLGDIVIEPDAAVLGLLLDSVGWDLFLLQRGFFFEGTYQVPDWIRPFHWEKTSSALRNLTTRSFVQHLTSSWLVYFNNFISSSQIDDNWSMKMYQAGNIIKDWMKSIDVSNSNLQENDSFSVSFFLSTLVKTSESKMFYYYLLQSENEDILKSICLFRNSYVESDDIVCLLKELFHSNVISFNQRTPIDYQTIENDFAGLLNGDSIWSTENNVYKVLKIFTNVIQNLFITSKSNEKERIEFMKLVNRLMQFVIHVDEDEPPNMNILEKFDDFIARVFMPRASTKKGGKWANEEEELMNYQTEFQDMLDKFLRSFLNVTKNVVENLLSTDSSVENKKLKEFIVVLSKINLKFKKNEVVKNLFQDLVNEIEKNEKGLKLLHDLVEVDSKPSNKATNGFEVISQLLRKGSSMINLLNFKENDNLDEIISSLLFFNEAIDTSVLNKVINGSLEDVSEAEFFVLESLQQSCEKMLQMAVNEIPQSTLSHHLKKITVGLNHMLRAEKSKKGENRDKLENLLINKSSLIDQINHGISLDEDLIKQLLSTRVDFDKIQEEIQNWQLRISLTCNQLKRADIDSKFVDLCNKLQNIEFPLIVLSHLNISSCIAQIDETALKRALDSNHWSIKELQKTYVQTLYLTNFVGKLHDVFDWLSIIDLEIDSQNNTNFHNLSESQIMTKFRGHLCFNHVDHSDESSGSWQDDICSTLTFLDSKKNPFVHGKILIVNNSPSARILFRILTQYLRDRIEEGSLTGQKLVRFSNENCASQLRSIVTNIQDKMQTRSVTLDLNSTIAVDFLLLKDEITNIKNYCEKIQHNRNKLTLLPSFLQTLTSCFTSDYFELVSSENFVSRAEELNREDKFIAGLNFSAVKFSSKNLTDNFTSSPVSYSIILLPENKELDEEKKAIVVSELPEISDSFRNSSQLWNTAGMVLQMIDKVLFDLFFDIDKLKTKGFSSTLSSEDDSSSLTIKDDYVKLTRKKRRTLPEANFNLQVHSVETPFDCDVKHKSFFQGVSSSRVLLSFVSIAIFSVFNLLIASMFHEQRKTLSEKITKLYSIDRITSSLILILFCLLVLLMETFMVSLLFWLLELLPKSSLLLIMTVSFLLGAQIIIICHCLSFLFLSKKMLMLCLLSLIWTSVIPYLLIEISPTSTSIVFQIMAISFPSSGFCLGFHCFYLFESIGIGASVNNVWFLPHEEDNLSLALVIIIQMSVLLILCLFDFMVTVTSLRHKSDKFLNFKVGSSKYPKPEDMEGFSVFQDPSTPEDSHLFSLHGFSKKSLRVSAIQKLIINEEGKTSIIGDNVTFNSYENQINVLYGPPKSGKTTILLMVAGIVTPSSGHVTVYGESLQEIKKRKTKILSFSGQKTENFDFMTVRESLIYWGYCKGNHTYSEIKKEAQSLMNLFNIQDDQHQKVRKCSDISKKAVSIATAFIGGSKIIILDEPTLGTDLAFRDLFFKVVTKYRKDRTILLATYDSRIVECLADEISVLDQGKILFNGTRSDLMQEFSPGYDVTIHFKVYNEQSLNSINNFDKERLFQEIFQDYYPTSSFSSWIKEKFAMKLNIPYLVVQLHPESFCCLLRDMEIRKEEFGISSVEVFHPTTEDILEIVLQLGDTFREQCLLTPEREELHKRNFNFSNPTDIPTCKRTLLTFGALVNKRFLHNIRRRAFYLQAIICPLFLITMAMFCLWLPSTQNKDPRTLQISSISNYGIYSFLKSNNSDYLQFVQFVGDSLLHQDQNSFRFSSDYQNCQREDVKFNFIHSDSQNCTYPFEIDYETCLCRNEHCNMKLVNENYIYMIPFDKRHIKFIPDLEFKENYSKLKSTEVYLHYEKDNKQSLLSMMKVLIRAKNMFLSGPDLNILTNLNFSPFEKIVGNEIKEENHKVLLSSFFLLIAITIGVVTSAAEIIGEKSRGEWTVFRTIGVPKTSYYLSFLVWNVLISCGIIFLMVILMVAFNDSRLVANWNFGSVSLLTFLYSLYLIPVTYLVGRLVPKEKEACLICISCHVFAGILLSFIECVYDSFDIIKSILLIFPPFAFSSGYRTLYLKNNQESSDENWLPMESSLNSSIRNHFFVLLFWSLATFVVLLIMESASLWKRKIFQVLQMETNFSRFGTPQDFSSSISLQFFDLNRSFREQQSCSSPPTSFNAYRREALCILGNGSFDASDFICGIVEELPSSGDKIKLYDPNGEEMLLEKTPHCFFSYCPSDPALDGFLTAEEEIHIISQLKGFSGDELFEIVHRALCTFDLMSVKNKKALDLSQEDKRKLILAKTALGNPKIVLLEDPLKNCSLKLQRLTLEFIRSVVNAFDTVILTSSNLKNVESISQRMIFLDQKSIAVSETTTKLNSICEGKYFVRLVVDNMEDLSSVIEILKEELRNFQLTSKWYRTLEAEVNCDMTPYCLFGAIAKCRESLRFWFQISTISLKEYQERVLSSCVRNSLSTLDIDQCVEEDDPSRIGFPTLYHGSSNSFYDNMEVDLTSDLMRPSKGCYGNKMRRSSGSSKLTPCSTPQPPRSPQPPSLELRYSMDRFSSVDLRRSVERRSSWDRPEGTLQLQMPRKSKRRPSKDAVDSSSLEKNYVKPNVANIRCLKSVDPQNMMERFLENLPDVNQEEPFDETSTYF